MEKEGTWFCLSQVVDLIREKNPNFPRLKSRKKIDFECWGNPKKLCVLIEFEDGRVASVRILFGEVGKVVSIRAMIATNKNLLVQRIAQRTRKREQEFASKRNPIITTPAA